MRITAFLLMLLAATGLSAQQAPTTGYAPFNGLEMYYEIHGDMRPRSASRLAILLDTTHVTLMQRRSIIVPMVNDFLDARP